MVIQNWRGNDETDQMASVEAATEWKSQSFTFSFSCAFPMENESNGCITEGHIPVQRAIIFHE